MNVRWIVRIWVGLVLWTLGFQQCAMAFHSLSFANFRWTNCYRLSTPADECPHHHRYHYRRYNRTNFLTPSHFRPFHSNRGNFQPNQVQRRPNHWKILKTCNTLAFKVNIPRLLRAALTSWRLCCGFLFTSTYIIVFCIHPCDAVLMLYSVFVCLPATACTRSRIASLYSHCAIFGLSISAENGNASLASLSHTLAAHSSQPMGKNWRRESSERELGWKQRDSKYSALKNGGASTIAFVFRCSYFATECCFLACSWSILCTTFWGRLEWNCQRWSNSVWNRRSCFSWTWLQSECDAYAISETYFITSISLFNFSTFLQFDRSLRLHMPRNVSFADYFSIILKCQPFPALFPPIDVALLGWPQIYFLLISKLKCRNAQFNRIRFGS